MEIDCRPSDALALAVRVNVPIYAADSVLEKASIMLDREQDKRAMDEMDLPEPPAGGKGEKTRKASDEEIKRLSAFRDFVDNLDLEDFDKRKS